MESNPKSSSEKSETNSESKTPNQKHQKENVDKEALAVS
jgi:hypothetical protein